jgi:hypothetical protein
MGLGALTPRAEATASPQSASNASDPIDELIASLLESFSSEHGTQAPGVDSDVRAVRIATVRPEVPRRRGHAPSTRTRTVPRPHLSSERVGQAFFFIAIVLLSIAVGVLSVYLMSP